MKPPIIVAILTVFLVCLGHLAHAASNSREFSECLKRTEQDRMECQSGCGMILQQCYDETDYALTTKTDALVTKQRSASCTALVKKYADGSAQLSSSVVDDAGSQSGWLGANLKMKLLQQRYETIRLIDETCT